ncbi:MULTISPECIES: UDP-4-amino-4,6-dideoxy-N-acetyl-beta-L-altrosamine transaminase [unclassified Sphingomonas]|uniref:UDP-4-amino-4, 6-dideoxy-N-acetyl-beta-L-altrosamine transaminase n=1 Tax=Sphingomonas TaxID=13687 RepID=UPI000A4477CA|nr:MULTISPECIES: UDP-4-amino-4,6-dideoxy-N-acetyl-beta-L-altrosamine transaminase [unclassified Sphingomonas]MBN8811838.1 UDP-4-amino-4,6-dideoxy-N-acetyl-beta-L-altrosamine transaminase [Sphingomonas sp.]
MSIIPYSCQNISDEDIAAVEAVLRSDFLTQGPTGPAFEAAFGERHKVKHAIAVSNATAALHIGCLALGVGAGSLVWTSPNSFLASANCALYCGADVDFVDIDPFTRNMSVAALAEKLAAADKSGRLPTVVVPVDFAGFAVDLKEMRELADQYGFKILEDASHATGASYLGEPIGSAWADATVFSFHAVKIVTTAEGGLITTNDDVLARKIRLLRSHGMTRDTEQMEGASEGDWYYEQVALGYNYRLTDMQSALGLSQLSRLDEWRRRRVELADRYDQLFAGMPLKLPARAQDRESAWHLYVIELSDQVTATRADVFSGMRAAGIGVNVHYIPIHTQPQYRRFGFRRGDFINAERYYDRAISIPLFPAMTHEQQQFVVDTLGGLLG